MRSGGNSIIGDGDLNPSKTENGDPHSGNCNSLFIVGIGPGDYSHMSLRAIEAIQDSEVIVGYSPYIDLIRPLVDGKKIISTPMKKEVDRVTQAIDAVFEGFSCSLISSGDPGIYAMAGLALELCKERGLDICRSQTSNTDSIQIEIVPGIPALASCAARLGAPLTHDFAVISLSDLLTPWPVIEKRITASAMADFVMVFFNPKSKKRNWQLSRAKELILNHRNHDTPVGIVKNATRKDEHIVFTSLGNLDEIDVDMFSTVIVGNTTTFNYKDFLITPRGYAQKYNMG